MGRLKEKLGEVGKALEDDGEYKMSESRAASFMLSLMAISP